MLSNLFKCIDQYEDAGYEYIGIDAAGQVDSTTGTIVGGTSYIPGYVGTELAKIVEEHYQKKVFVENDVNAAALGEGVYGAAKSMKNYLCLTYGTGVGGAIVINGELYKGAKGIAGEMGHFVVHSGGKKCSCGRKGCYEQYASTTALVLNCRKISNNYTNGRIIFEEFYKGNNEVKNVVDRWIDEIVLGLANLIHIFNPEGIVLGGGVMKQKYIIEEINERISEHIMPCFANLKIASAQLGNDAGMYGMLSVINKYLKN